jgi:long-chain acyl-CoA synthetase
VPALSDVATSTPDKPAVIEEGDGGRSRTYAELSARVNRLARVYQQLGADRTHPVAVMLPNSVELIEAGLATAVAQAPLVPVNWHLKADELGYVLADSGARVVVTARALQSIARAATANNSQCTVIVTGDDGSYEAAMDVESDAPVAGAWSAPSWMFYTSGTTGRPKGVVYGELNPAAADASQSALSALWGFTADDVHCLAGPGYHAGPGGYCFATMWNGGTVVLLPQWEARAFLGAVERHRVSTTFLTPAHFIRIVELGDDYLATCDVSSLRLVIHAGAPCPVEVKRRMLELLPQTDVSELYGASEGGVTKITAADWLTHPGSVGTTWPGVEVRILTEAGEQLPAGQDGLIYVRPAADRRFYYHGDDEKTAAAWRDDAFTVGDIGHLDEEGYLYITDRASDMVIWGGVNIYPREIEEVLHTHPAVVDCAVFGVPDDRYGETLKAVVEVRSDVSVDDLRAHVAAHLADFKVPQLIELVSTLPRDPNGKVLKRFLREQHVKATS